MSFWKNNKNDCIDVYSPEELLCNLPKWCVGKNKPRHLFSKKKEYIQVALISRIVGTRTFWGELDGMGYIKTDTRAYKIPKENIYGDIFIWDVDKKVSVNEILNVDKEDAEDSYHLLTVANANYTAGKLSGSPELNNKLTLITILCCVALLASLVCIALVYQQTKTIDPMLHAIFEKIPEKAQEVVIKP